MYTAHPSATEQLLRQSPRARAGPAHRGHGSCLDLSPRGQRGLLSLTRVSPALGLSFPPSAENHATGPRPGLSAHARASLELFSRLSRV